MNKDFSNETSFCPIAVRSPIGTRYSDRLKQLSCAVRLKRNLGTRCAAGYLRNRGWSLEAAMYVLCRKEAITASPVGA